MATAMATLVLLVLGVVFGSLAYWLATDEDR